ncbi:hypothetical protein AGMMS49579_26540 [Spirochaetia bacterium]|nr:hypothetical protein AGMMS49579_26540 [Spirochaetia bacterium]
MKKLFLIITVILTLNACYTTPKSEVATNVDFSKYAFAAIGTDTSGSNVILADARIKIQNALASFGYNVISDTRISALDFEERSRLFYVEFSISSNLDESVCLIYFTDYLSDNIIATFRGSFGFGFNITGDQRGAVDSAIKQMLNVLPQVNKQN